MMFRRTAVVKPASAVAGATHEPVAATLGPASILSLSAWCGVVSGLLEVGTIVLRKQTFDPNRLYGMSRHFLWVIPITNLCVFLGLGIVLCLAAWVWPRRGSWLAVRSFRAFAPSQPAGCRSPDLWPRVAGNNARGRFERGPASGCRAPLLRRLTRISFPVAVLFVVVPAAYLWGTDRLKERRERARPLPQRYAARMSSSSCSTRSRPAM